MSLNGLLRQKYLTEKVKNNVQKIFWRQDTMQRKVSLRYQKTLSFPTHHSLKCKNRNAVNHDSKLKN
ncbi:hypothetical protein GWI33_009387 [Rhynchophorus ferrugineus]|uniref:Uncharacterized protein n=1 Tax=Rhynchophorus ferrugineus TaxID=354439 RepID=A0A834IVK9_RHYFE|nr:hypothetical protein GWI33_009387 [Rhynchophorus ferrugineus]